MLGGKLRKEGLCVDYIGPRGWHDWVVGRHCLAVATCRDQRESLEPQWLRNSRKQRNRFRVVRGVLLDSACVGSRHADRNDNIGDQTNFKLRHHRTQASAGTRNRLSINAVCAAPVCVRNSASSSSSKPSCREVCYS